MFYFTYIIVFVFTINHFRYCVGHYLMSNIKSGSRSKTIWEPLDSSFCLFGFLYYFGFILAFNLKWSRSAEMNVLFLGLYMNSLIVCCILLLEWWDCAIWMWLQDNCFFFFSPFDQRPFQRPLASRVKLSPFVEQYGVFPISFTLFFSSPLIFSFFLIPFSFTPPVLVECQLLTNHSFVQR